MSKPPAKASVLGRIDDPRDEIRRPLSTMALSLYYVDRWLPELGERGHVIVTVLRRMGFYDRRQDVVRGEVEIEQTELAKLCGLKLRTFQREFAEEGGAPVNPALHRFVQRQFRTYQNTAGHVVRERTIYVVEMKDPIHDADLDRLREIVEAREKGVPAEDPGSRHSGGNGMPRIRQVGGAGRQPDAGTRQDDAPARQIGGNSNVESDSDSPQHTSSDVARRGPLSLFQGGEEPEGEERPPAPDWNVLAEVERSPWLGQARREIAAASGREASALNPGLVETRARNLYRLSARGKP